MMLVARRAPWRVCARWQSSSASRSDSTIAAALTAGGDDRSALNAETGLNKYHTAPWPLPEDAIFRGSCTCNPPTPRGAKAARELLAKLESGYSRAEAAASVRARLARVLDLPEGSQVMLTPSGSDAELACVAAAQVLSSKKLVNVVAQMGEIGAGSSHAAGLRYFSKLTPLGSDMRESGQLIAGADDMSVILVPARDSQTAKQTTELTRATDEALLPETFGVVHAVAGGKTGLVDVARRTDEKALGVVDACQGRFELSTLHAWLSMENIVLFTGSKFYRGPPFSGAVIFPAGIAATIASNPPPAAAAHLSEFVSVNDLPDALSHWAPKLQQEHNEGLLLRWEAALAEMERPGALFDAAAAEDWAERCTAELVPEFERLRVFDANLGILSVTLLDDHGRSLDEKALRSIYAQMSDQNAGGLNVVAHIGQPVVVAPETVVLRLALGVDSLALFKTTPEEALEQDRQILAKLNLLALGHKSDAS